MIIIIILNLKKRNDFFEKIIIIRRFHILYSIKSSNGLGLIDISLMTPCEMDAIIKDVGVINHKWRFQLRAQKK
jgi:ABC-type antimicrobial peptide transport system permease subunit